jgi:ABC-2 type transport system permease protein
MLWYKGWLETRFKLLFTLGFTIFLLFFQHSVASAAPHRGAKNLVVGFVTLSNPFLVVMVCALLAGAGVITQPSFQATKGLHGSTFFTLSLPVSRLRLLAVRSGIGWLELVGVIGVLCCGMWFIMPAYRAMSTPIEMLAYAGTLIATASFFYYLSVLLATFLDDQWRVWGSMIAYALLGWLSVRAPLPVAANIFRAMRDGSPLVAHTVPWTTAALSLGLAAILFFAALKIVQAREY